MTTSTTDKTDAPHSDDPETSRDLALALAFYEAGFAAARAIGLLTQRRPALDPKLLEKLKEMGLPHIKGSTADGGGQVQPIEGMGGTTPPDEPFVPEIVLRPLPGEPVEVKQGEPEGYAEGGERVQKGGGR